MMTKSEVRNAQLRAAEILKDAGICITDQERDQLEIADMGLGELERSGLQVLVYENNDRYCAKDLILFPGQTCPEHLHPPIGKDPGKRETFRCRTGLVHLFVEGPETAGARSYLPEGSEEHYTVFHQITLSPGQQYTIQPGIKHWFKAGDAPCIVSEFSSPSHDEFDIFTDPRIQRIPEAVDG